MTAERTYSVIISGYKDSAVGTLEQCLRLRQNEDVTFEIVFADNTTDSRHREAAEKLFDATRDVNIQTAYISHPVPGKAAAQNRAISEAKGRFYVFLDDDILPDANLIIQYDRGFLLHHCAAIQGRVELLFEDGVAVPEWLDQRFRLDLAEMDFGRVIIPFKMGLTGANMAFRAEVFEKYGMFDEKLGPGRSGTLADQEYSERIRREGEVQLYWPSACVKHVIPQDRLTIRSFAKTYYDVGFSDYYLSKHLIRGGRIKFTLYTIKKCLFSLSTMLKMMVTNRQAGYVKKYCELFKLYGYWKQAMRYQ